MTLAEQFQQQGVRFYHNNVLLPDGSRTARDSEGGVDFEPWPSACGFDLVSFLDKSVLDVGCWDGAFAFVAEQRGASPVVGLDNVDLRMWDKGSNLAWSALHNVFQSKAVYKHGTIYALPYQDRSFDIVLCLGVLYHLSDPLKGLNECFRCCKERVIVESWANLDKQATLSLYAPGEIVSHDMTNVYCPSEGWFRKVGEMNGFKVVYSRRSFYRRICMHFVRDTELVNLHPPTVFP